MEQNSVGFRSADQYIKFKTLFSKWKYFFTDVFMILLIKNDNVNK